MQREKATDPPTRHTNRLAGETSPYLLQHAHNPVDWEPWGPDALTRAKAEDKPIFLSIGYAACHWCHVMERESFEDQTTADQLNAGFVSIKVDREERPDLDAIYMDAVQTMTGQGGWPMTVFLTPDGKPFYGGTYFPNVARYGMPSFRDVLTGVTRVWREQRGEAEAAGERLRRAIDASARGTGSGTDDHEHDGPDTGHDHGHDHENGDETAPAAGPTAAPEPAAWMFDAALTGLEDGFDPVTGGWGRAPKFPQPMSIEALLREHVRTGNARPLDIARRSLDAMADGGIYDHVGGGFARYATDAVWLVPHFEKMLYDNAQLARVYLHAWQLTGDQRYREVVEETLDYVAREMRIPEGAFTASQDADTDGEEGLTYVWEASEVREVLGEEAELFMRAYGVRDSGNWEGKTILSRVRDDASLAKDEGIGVEAVRERLARARAQLFDRRLGRPQPARDDKVLAAWNGLMLAAFAEASRALRSPMYRDVAESAAGFLLDALRDERGRLRRSWKDRRASHNGVLEDYANLAEGLLALYEATFEERWFVAARELMDAVLEHFGDPAGGGFFDTSDDHEQLITRPKGLQDNATPSGNATAATVLLRLAALSGEARYRDAAEVTLRLVTRVVTQYPTAFAQWLVAMHVALTPLDEIAVVGDPAADDTRALLDVAFAGYRPSQVVACALDGDASAVPLLHGRPLVGGRATAYVCRGFACQRPVTEPVALVRQLTTG